MAVTEIVMQDVDAEINTGTIAVPVWTQIGGITGITPSPSTTRANTHNFDTPGRNRHRVVRRGDSFTIAAQRQEDESDGSRDPGQEAIEAAGRAYGTAAEKQYRFTFPGGGTMTFVATAEVTPFGGGTDDVANWQAVLEVTGDVTVA